MRPPASPEIARRALEDLAIDVDPLGSTRNQAGSFQDPNISSPIWLAGGLSGTLLIACPDCCQSGGIGFAADQLVAAVNIAGMENESPVMLILLEGDTNLSIFIAT